MPSFRETLLWETGTPLGAPTFRYEHDTTFHILRTYVPWFMWILKPDAKYLTVGPRDHRENAHPNTVDRAFCGRCCSIRHQSVHGGRFVAMWPSPVILTCHCVTAIHIPRSHPTDPFYAIRLRCKLSHENVASIRQGYSRRHMKFLRRQCQPFPASVPISTFGAYKVADMWK